MNVSKKNKTSFVCSSKLFFCHDSDPSFPLFIFLVLQDFVDLLREQAPLESYVEWLDRLVETKIIRVCSYNVMFAWNARDMRHALICTWYKLIYMWYTRRTTSSARVRRYIHASWWLLWKSSQGSNTENRALYFKTKSRYLCRSNAYLKMFTGNVIRYGRYLHFHY